MAVLHQNSRFTPKWYITLKGWQMAAARDIRNTKYNYLSLLSWTSETRTNLTKLFESLHDTRLQAVSSGFQMQSAPLTYIGIEKLS